MLSHQTHRQSHTFSSLAKWNLSMDSKALGVPHCPTQHDEAYVAIYYIGRRYSVGVFQRTQQGIG